MGVPHLLVTVMFDLSLLYASFQQCCYYFCGRESEKALCGEVTWVVSDYNGGPGELSVRAGQQVEVLDQNNADQLLVRLCPNTLSEVTRPATAERDLKN